MPCFLYRRRTLRPFRAFGVAAVAAMALSCAAQQAADATTAPASIPAGTLQARTPAPSARTPATVSVKQSREADDAYLEGAKLMEHDDLPAAERSFAQAVQLNPNKQEYVLSLAIAREHHLTELVQSAAKARLLGDNAKADALLAQARTLDPENNVITQHLGVDASALPDDVNLDALRNPAPELAGPIEFAPTPGKKDIHHRGGAQDVVRSVYADFGVSVVFDSSFTNSAQIRFDLDNVDFATATRVLAEMAHMFAVAVQPRSALIAKNSPEDRDRLMPLVEETLYLPGISNDTMTELANLARNVFELKQVNASATEGRMLIRGDESTVKALNATYADMLDGGSDVLLDIKLYEISKDHLVNIGASLPSSLSAFSLVTTGQNLINANQTLINEAISSGALKLTGTSAANELTELAFLVAAGVSGASQFTSLLGTIGNYGGLPLLGVDVGSSGTFNLLLTSSDVRLLDDVQIRGGDNQPLNFRAGTRYPIVTATYSSGVSSSLASQLSGVSINGTSAASLLAQYGGASSSVTVPQVQYEDLGITIKATPKIQRSGDVSVALDMKIEALGSGTIDSIPILNNRSFTSTVAIPAGQTALMASAVSRNEARDIEGIPGLSELPGFQGTEKSAEIDSDELLITITPHVVRRGRFRVTSRRIIVDRPSSSSD
jgi:general secretion pathway protein D